MIKFFQTVTSQVTYVLLINMTIGTVQKRHSQSRGGGFVRCWHYANKRMVFRCIIKASCCKNSKLWCVCMHSHRRSNDLGDARF